jgi:hypothetical protein
MLDLLMYLGIGILIVSYLYLAYFFIKEKIYTDLGLFDVVIFLLGPLGLLFILLISHVYYNDDDLND